MKVIRLNYDAGENIWDLNWEAISKHKGTYNTEWWGGTFIILSKELDYEALKQVAQDIEELFQSYEDKEDLWEAHEYNNDWYGYLFEKDGIRYELRSLYS